MENLAGEEVIKLGNTSPLQSNGRQGKRKEMNFYFRNKIKIEGKEEEVHECKDCHKILPQLAFGIHTMRSNGAYALKRLCRECASIIRAEIVKVKRKAPLKSNDCDNCHKNKNLEIDHIHGSVTFRGWLCRNCNTGIGALGDTLEGVLRAAIYLEKNTDKIIETLNGIKNEKKR